MSIDQRPTLITSSIEGNEQKEALKQSAENFLIGLGLAVLKAKETPEYVIEDPGLVSYIHVVNHRGALACITIQSMDAKEHYSLIPTSPCRLISYNHKIEQERIYVSKDKGELTVLSSGRIGSSGYGHWTETVSNPDTGSMLDDFVSDLRPISEAEHIALKTARTAPYRRAKNEGFGKKLVRLLGRGK